MRYYLIALCIIVLDQLTKWWIIANMEIGESIKIIENVLYITSHRNPGAAWGILEGQMIFFYIITLIVIGAIVYYMKKFAEESKWNGFALALVLGGAIGNFIDRIRFQEVVDFINVYIGSYNFPIFNVADLSLVVGVSLIAIMTIREELRKGRAKK
ncbi:signal peptidase II [Amphibacillus sediminis]|uniref:signal peptidase II n=1 Tax=Amphibacillus sediminis TaxID=360185 RepID=UPI0008347EFF|nr:signal peptidase II [Amphibacillus sediminis]